MENQHIQYLNGVNGHYESDVILYEKSRIKALSEQREATQKKIFTKWVNSHLLKESKEKYFIKDLYVDLKDGKALLKLLEIISGEKLPPFSKGKSRIYCIENVTKSIKFLNDKHVYLENVGAGDIVDGNPNLILGLLWSIILKYQIKDDNEGKQISKESLMLWCQMKTASYNNVNIVNFSTSWKDGLAFNALLDKHCPDVVDYFSLTKENAKENLKNAFEIAEREFKVPQLLDSTDFNLDQPEERSIMMYVAALRLALNRITDLEQ